VSLFAGLDAKGLDSTTKIGTLALSGPLIIYSSLYYINKTHFSLTPIFKVRSDSSWNFSRPQFWPFAWYYSLTAPRPIFHYSSSIVL